MSLDHLFKNKGALVCDTAHVAHDCVLAKIDCRVDVYICGI